MHFFQFSLGAQRLVWGLVSGLCLAALPGLVMAQVQFAPSFVPFDQVDTTADIPSDIQANESTFVVEKPAASVDAPSQTLPSVQFRLVHESGEAEAFANQVMAQVARNLSGVASLTAPSFEIDPMAMDQDMAVAPPLAQAASIDGATLRVQGEVSYQNGQLIEMTVAITSPNPANTRRENLSLRLDVADWQRAGNYLSNTLYSRLTGRMGYFQSQIAFVAHRSGPGGPTRRLAMVDQSGRGWAFIAGAGDQVAAPTFLSNRFEIAFLDQRGGRNRLMHYNTLTTRLTYMMTLPDLEGAPALAKGGRLVAFAAREDGHGALGADAADIYVSDVEMGKIKAIEIPGSVDSHPQFSPDVKVLCFISARPTWSELIVSAVPYAMVDRDRTRADDEETMMDGLGDELRSLYGTPHALRQPVWSPDGQALAFIEQRADHSLLMHLDLKTGQSQVVARAPKLRDPVWSPDGREVLVIAHRADESGDPAGALTRVNLAEGTLSVIPTALEVTSPTWSHNGSSGSVVEQRASNQ